MACSRSSSARHAVGTYRISCSDAGGSPPAAARSHSRHAQDQGKGPRQRSRTLIGAQHLAPRAPTRPHVRAPPNGRSLVLARRKSSTLLKCTSSFSSSVARRYTQGSARCTHARTHTARGRRSWLCAELYIRWSDLWHAGDEMSAPARPRGASRACSHSRNDAATCPHGRAGGRTCIKASVTGSSSSTQGPRSMPSASMACSRACTGAASARARGGPGGGASPGGGGGGGPGGALARRTAVCIQGERSLSRTTLRRTTPGWWRALVLLTRQGQASRSQCLPVHTRQGQVKTAPFSTPGRALTCRAAGCPAPPS